MTNMDMIDSLITIDLDGMIDMESEIPEETKNFTLDGTEI